MFNCVKNCLFYLIKNKQMTNPGDNDAFLNELFRLLIQSWIIINPSPPKFNH